MDLNIINYSELAYNSNYKPIKYATKNGKDYWLAISTVKYNAMGREFTTPKDRQIYTGDNSEILNSISWKSFPFGAPTSYTGGTSISSALSYICNNIGINKGKYFTHISSNNTVANFLDAYDYSGGCKVRSITSPYRANDTSYYVVFGIAEHSNYPDVSVIYKDAFPQGASDTSGECYQYGDNLLDAKSGYFGDKKIVLLSVSSSIATIGTWLPEGKTYYEHLQKIDQINSGDAGNDAYTLGLRDYDIKWDMLGVNDIYDWLTLYGDNIHAQWSFKDGGYSDALNSTISEYKTWVYSGVEMNQSTIEKIKYTTWDLANNAVLDDSLDSYAEMNGFKSNSAFLIAKVPLEEISKHYKLCPSSNSNTEITGYLGMAEINACAIGNSAALIDYDTKKMFIVTEQRGDYDIYGKVDVDLVIGNEDLSGTLGKKIKSVTSYEDVVSFAEIITGRINNTTPLPFPLKLYTSRSSGAGDVAVSIAADSAKYDIFVNKAYTSDTDTNTNALYVVDIDLSDESEGEAELIMESWVDTLNLDNFGDGVSCVNGRNIFEYYSQPVVEEPVVEEPVVQQPVAEEPVIEEPVVQQPVAQEGVNVDYDTTESNYDNIDSLLDEYIDAANYAADELQDANKKIEDYKELCKLDPNNADACESVSELEEYIKELQAELDNLSSQSGALEAFKGLIATRLSSTYGLNISQGSTNEQIVSAIETKLEGLKSDLASKTQEYDDKVAQYNSLVAEEEELAKELQDALADDAADDAEIAKLKSDIAGLEAANLALSGDEDELNDLVTNLQNEVKRLEGELEDADDGVTSASVAAVQAKLDEAEQLNDNMEEYRNKLIRLITSYNEVSISIGGDPIPNNLSAMDFGEVIKLANSYKKELLDELSKVGTIESQEYLSNEINALNNEVDLYKEYSIGLDTQLSDLTSDKQDLQNQLNTLQTQYDELVSEHQYLNENSVTTFQNKNEEIAAQEAELDRLEADIQSLESQLETATDTIAVRDTTIAGLNNSELTLASQVLSLNAQLETLNSQLNDSLESYKTSKTNELNAEIDTLVSQGVLEQGYALGLENLISDWSDANSEISRLGGELDSLSNSISQGTISEAGLLEDKNKLSAELAQANNTISNQNTQLNNLIDDIESANSEIDQFNLFENKLKNALNTLEGKLTPLGYQKSSSFNGDGGFNPFGSNPTEFQKLMFRGMKARKAYLNMSGGKDKGYSNFAYKDEDGDLVSPILKIGLIAGLAYVASKFFKK